MHLLVVVARPAVMRAFERRVEEGVAVGLGAVAGGRAAVDAALVPPLLERAGARAAALATHVHPRGSDLTNHALLLYTRTQSTLPHLTSTVHCITGRARSSSVSSCSLDSH